LDAYLCKQEVERLQRLELEGGLGQDLVDKPRRESASQIDDFFDPRAQPGLSYVSQRSVLSVQEDDVFLKPPLWEDIASSIQKLDPENAEMLGTLTQVKIELPDDQVNIAFLLSPIYIIMLIALLRLCSFTQSFLIGWKESNVKKNQVKLLLKCHKY
jgi:hypothetical protein